MMRIAIAAIFLLGAMLQAQASSGNQRIACFAKVLKSEELPYAPVGDWLVKVVLEIIPPSGSAYTTQVQRTIPWQGPLPRRNQLFAVWCDPVHPGDLHLM